MEILDLIESYNHRDASERALYAREGRRVRGGRNDAKYKRALVEAGRLYGDVLNGRVKVDRLQEAMTTSDFQYLFADILDRQLLAKYQHRQVMWDQIARRGRVRDFRKVKRFTLDGGEAVLDEVPQNTEYPAAAVTDGKYEYQVKKYGKRLPFTWEDFINDDLDALRDMPDRLANSARFSEEKFFTSLFAESTGPDSTFYSSGNANQVTGNPTLGIPGLNTAFNVLAAQKDTDGNPIYIDAVTLVVPPALEITALNIINATEILAADGGGDGTGNNQLRVTNWMRNRVKLVVDPWLPIIDTTSGNTAWYLFANPSVGRPAMEIGFLTGHETPELFMQSPNAVRVGGGAVDPMDGDFRTDSIDWKVRYVFGGTLMDPKSSVASSGAGS
ncbi:phage major capsid protein [Actinomadura madurae]|uniref:phage major capsid protein n=1 Tax=Actinomadura madurae TaxID=1993 RepID=UPI0020D24B9D|nr:Mu-like prophage major head subunit gpT family protein [Actinomadura madurae]MCP9947271.1 Mu-like prophage major head subunit gpT family protein [Actinomadura madurae]MCP9964034.1 Mu-like prophage major head subunit gpT family protein [Actinomadura madurae]MCP9976507.1 Mu-like prophage major head subunit gpT family protein [Actinomadura madurae]MCQ0011996.1 Mu-like prophage major head subunit gpT family protein [Actinomadura madurae]MCQ0012703.1 Mu-like prophage major head subunit gpT famil